MDRPHRGAAGPARTRGAPVTANLAVAAESRTGNIVEARNLVKSFGETPALRGASLTVRPGEIVAVMGPSGSGKSTLLHCLAGILVPEQGEVWFAAKRFDTLNDDQRSALRRDRFGFVFQSGQLVPEMTAEENVALPLLLSGTRRGPAMTAARNWFGTLGLDGLEGRRSGELSGGQAQRVALARGLAAGPEVLFADEPTGSLDSVSGELVMDLLTAAAREHGTTVVLVTHDARVAAYADREVIVRDGTVSTLLSNPTNSGYQQLANTVILVSLPIAGCTLAAGIAAGLADRKRPFSMLRLTGARLGMLRRVVALESAVPLLAVAAVAIGTGFGATAMYASREMQHPMVAPGAAYYLLTAGGILVALGIIAATFPLLARITGPEVARNE